MFEAEGVCVAPILVHLYAQGSSFPYTPFTAPVLLLLLVLVLAFLLLVALVVCGVGRACNPINECTTVPFDYGVLVFPLAVLSRLPLSGGRPQKTQA